MIFKGNIEICEIADEEVAGRAKIKMTALKISKDDYDNNDNGINWTKENVENNMKSLIGGAFKVDFIDEDKTYPSGHGKMEYDDEGNVIFPSSDSVGSIQEVSIDTIIIDDEECEVLSCVGYIYKQSYPNFYEWLKEHSKENVIYGSVEINGRNGAKSIVYENGSQNEDGTPLIGRKPKLFDFVSIAILSIVPPADKFSRVIEVNSKQKEDDIKIMPKEKLIKTSQKVEINELDLNDISCIITRAFNKIMSLKSDDNDDRYYGYKYWIHKLYPQSGTVIMSDYSDTPTEYYKTTYTIQGKEIILGDVVEVEQDWKMVNDEQEVEINSEIIKNKLLNSKTNKEGNPKMDEKIVLELNQKLEDKVTEINSLTSKTTELTSKNTELNEAVVNANKTLEEMNAKNTEITEELNACKAELEALKAEKAEAETEMKKAEINSYFETEIPKNGFAEEEINSLKSYVEKVDLAGLKSAEAEICAKKFKEMISKSKTDESNVEINSKHSFITVPEPQKKNIPEASGFQSFFD